MVAKTYDRQTAKFLAVVGENMPELPGEIMQGWIQNPKSLQEVLRQALVPTEEKKVPTYAVVVDYSRSVEEMVSSGHYDWSNSNITSKNFPHDKNLGKRETEIELVHFNKVMTTDEVLRELDARDLRPATPPELLALGEKHPGLQLEFPIVALGSSWQDPDGGRRVPCLDGRGASRYLRLDWTGRAWIGIYRFAAVRK